MIWSANYLFVQMIINKVLSYALVRFLDKYEYEYEYVCIGTFFR